MIFQSHWSKPSRWQTQNDTIADMLFMYAASAQSLKEAFGTKVAMITDSAFAAILADLPMPYDYVSTELDGITEDPRWWAAPKFHIFMKYAGAYPWMLQADTDVFFWEPMTIGSHVDLLVQSVEQGHVFEDSYTEPIKFFQKKFTEMGMTPQDYSPWTPNCGLAYNCGIVGFRQPEMAIRYASMAKSICDVMTPYLDEFTETLPFKKRVGSIMVIPEQYFLKCFATAHDLRPAYVSTKIERGEMYHYDPKDYYHAMASKKDPKVREKFRKMVAKKQPELYKAIMGSAYGGL